MSARSHLVATFHLKGSHGYHIDFEASPHPATVVPRGTTIGPELKHGAATVSVEKGGAFSYYTAPATVTRRRVKARIGRFGRVRLRFHPGAHPFRASGLRKLRHCFGSLSEESGSFKGRFNFKGEDSYTQAHARKLRGNLDQVDQGCTGHDHGIRLIASSGKTHFRAERDRTYPMTSFAASTREKKGRVLIDRVTDWLVQPEEFTFDEGLTTAHVEPAEGPFSGSADFADPGAWTGSLTVSFPGESNVPLTGPGYVATLKHY